MHCIKFIVIGKLHFLERHLTYIHMYVHVREPFAARGPPSRMWVLHTCNVLMYETLHTLLISPQFLFEHLKYAISFYV